MGVVTAPLCNTNEGIDQMNPLLKQARRLIGMTANPIFRIDAIRRYAMTHAVPPGVRDDYPCLEAKHMDSPRLFHNRYEMVSSIQSAKGGVIAEVGVALGDFSEHLLKQLSPKLFVAIDTFTLHENPILGWGPWGRNAKSETIFGTLTHLDYYKQRFAEHGPQVVAEVGMSDVCLSQYPDKYFNLIYLDADHSYESVKRDAEVARIKLVDDGIIIFNDYIMFDHFNGIHYGVVQAVNELVVNENWRVCGFALHKHMFCDIAVRKQPGVPL
jgi:hypothetical protein